MKSIYDEEYRRIVRVLIDRRKALGMTQVDLARKLGVPQPFVSKVETFARRIDIVETVRICEALGLSIGDLVIPSSPNARGQSIL